MKQDYLFVGGPCDGSHYPIEPDVLFVRVVEQPTKHVPLKMSGLAAYQNFPYHKLNLGSRAEPQFVFAAEGWKHGDVIRALIGKYPRS